MNHRKAPKLSDNVLCAFDLKVMWDKLAPNYNAKYLSLSSLERYYDHKLKVLRKAKIKPTDQVSALAEYTRQVEEFVYGELLTEIQFIVKEESEGKQ
jgi:hypothetical protein